jgi:hypothetical protein
LLSLFFESLVKISFFISGGFLAAHGMTGSLTIITKVILNNAKRSEESNPMSNKVALHASLLIIPHLVQLKLLVFHSEVANCKFATLSWFRQRLNAENP